MRCCCDYSCLAQKRDGNLDWRTVYQRVFILTEGFKPHQNK